MRQVEQIPVAISHETETYTTLSIARGVAASLVRLVGRNASEATEYPGLPLLSISRRISHIPSIVTFHLYKRMERKDWKIVVSFRFERKWSYYDFFAGYRLSQFLSRASSIDAVKTYIIPWNEEIVLDLGARSGMPHFILGEPSPVECAVEITFDDGGGWMSRSTCTLRQRHDSLNDADGGVMKLSGYFSHALDQETTKELYARLGPRAERNAEGVSLFQIASLRREGQTPLGVHINFKMFEGLGTLHYAVTSIPFVASPIVTKSVDLFKTKPVTFNTLAPRKTWNKGWSEDPVARFFTTFATQIPSTSDDVKQ